MIMDNAVSPIIKMNYLFLNIGYYQNSKVINIELISGSILK